MASDDTARWPLLQREAAWAASYDGEGFKPWNFGYILMFLAEYRIATGDASVMSGIERLANQAVEGQSAVGTWGHNFALPNGNLNGYGCMNQPGITLTIGLELAHEAGMKSPALDRAIAKATSFVRWYVNKGAVPYGDHQPWNGHEDNGKCASAAVMFDLIGDREAAEFFAKMATAGYSERERGHTGNYFNVLWALPGVARCGPLATGAYFKEQGWYYDLARGWDGFYHYQGSPIGEEEHNTYTDWDCSGGYLLSYALLKKNLILTGKKKFSVTPLDAAQVAEVIAAGRDYEYKGEKSGYDSRSTEQLLAGLSSWSPPVRTRSAQALARRQGDFVPTLLKMLDGPDRDTRYGACEALGALGARSDTAGPHCATCSRIPIPGCKHSPRRRCRP